MNAAWKIIAALCLALLVTGCATTLGKDFDQGKVSSFTPHQTTIDQAISVLGQAQERETESDGGVRLHYQYVSSKSSVGSYIPGVSLVDHGVSTTGKDSFLYFDRSGKFLRAENNLSNM
jgi:hypothetical protein